MKKTLLALFVALLGLTTAARPVEPGKARQIAENILLHSGMANVNALEDVSSTVGIDGLLFFVNPEGGFVVLSADDCARPVVAVSLTAPFDAKQMPPQVRGFFENRAAEIRALSQSPAGFLGRLRSADLRSPEWQLLEAGQMPTPPLLTAVAPLMSTTWNQSPYYNSLCPTNGGEAERSVTGCVATATAQIMKYHNHPTTGYGSSTYSSERTINGTTYSYPNLTANYGATTYQWSSMPNELNSSSSAAQVSAVATLMYHIGVANEMSYSPEASGSADYNYAGKIRPSSQTSLMRYFKYRPDISVIHRSGYSDADYCTFLRNELDQSRPMLYSGRDPSGGHSFVLDGYNTQGLFHVNWGWGGVYDGYYAIGALNPSNGGTGSNATNTFNIDNVTILNIRPNTSWSTTSTTTISASVYGSTPGCSVSVYRSNRTSETTNTFSFGDTITLLATAPVGYRFDHWIDGDKNNPRQLIANGGNYTFSAVFSTIGYDTITYANLESDISSYSFGSNDNYWGVLFPISAIGNNRQLEKVMFYAPYSGTYDIRVFSGSNHSTLEAQTSTYVSPDDADSWRTVVLPSPVEATSNLWIQLHSSDAAYPAAFCGYSGVPSSLLVGENLTEYGEYWQCTFLIKGIFADVNQCIVSSFPYTEDFENQNTLSCLTIIDQDGDNQNWFYYGQDTMSVGHNSIHGIASASWNSNALTPDNWLVLPAFVFPAGSNMHLRWYSKGQDPDYAAEHFSVYLSTTGNNVSNFTSAPLYSGTTTASWEQHDIDLSSYAGQTVYIAFRHHNISDMFLLVLDDISVYNASAAPNPPSQDTCIIQQFPYTMDFESSVACWSLRNNNQDTITWGIINGYGYNGSHCAYVTYAVNADDWLISPAIATPGTYTLSWKTRVMQSSYPETYQVYSLSSDTAILLFSETLSDTIYQTRSAEFTILPSDTVNIVFRYISNDMYALFLDDVRIAQTVQPPTQYTLTVLSANTSMGTVTGGGTYTAGSTANLAATPAAGYHFSSWQDGNTDNPRTVTVTADATYIASFVPNVGIDEAVHTPSLSPNPAHNTATLQGIEEGTLVLLTDLNGREHQRLVAASSTLSLDLHLLPRGTYFVRLLGTSCNSALKLIVD